MRHVTSRRLLALALLALCALGLAGCAAEPAGTAQQALVVGFSQLGSESGWRIGNTASMEQAAERWGFGLMMTTPTSARTSRSRRSAPSSPTRWT